MNRTYYKILIDLKNSLFKGLLLVAGVTDNKDLSKNVSGQPNRYLLAFFTPEICPATQTGQNDSVSTSYPFTGVNRHKFMAHLPAIYEGEDIAKYKSLIGEYAGRLLTLPRVIPPQPIFNYRLNLTQNKTLGGLNHAR